MAEKKRNIVSKCYDLVEDGCWYVGDHIKEHDILLEAINVMDEETRNKFWQRLCKIEGEGYEDQWPSTDDDGNPITEEEQGRADHEQDRINKGEDQ